MVERWVDIAGFEGLYQVSDLGQVRSIPRGKRKGRVLKICYDSDGYPLVSLSREGKRHNGIVHKLVARAFVANPNNAPEIDHCDGDKLNCVWTNLEWVTRKENAARAAQLGLYQRGETHTATTITEDDVRNIRHAVSIGIPKKHVAKAFAVDQATVANIVSGKTWGHVPFDDESSDGR